MARLGLLTAAGVLLGCGGAPPSLAPLPSPPAVCPAEGCDGARTAAIRASHGPDACPGAGEAPCGGASPHECTARALAAWADARDDREVACVARTLGDACTLGDPPACGFAGRMWLEGRGAAKDPEQGLAMLSRACEEGIALDCMVGIRWLAEPAHAQAVRAGGVVRERLEKEHGCVTGSGDTCLELGIALEAGRPPFARDPARSVVEYGRGCNLGNGIACNNLGDAYEYGHSVPRDLSHAASLYERACHAGRPLGCANLGHLVEHGEGVAQDPVRARRLYRESCAAGEVYGCFHAQMMAAEDAGAPHDPQRSVAHWQRACDARDARGCAFVGLLFEDGPDGFARDEARSGRAMKRACDLGLRPACEWMEEHPAP